MLARGGSGDILTGILGALLAKKKNAILEQCCLVVQWHRRAAEALARKHGQESENNHGNIKLLIFRYTK